jgi:hypothetical protein
MGGAVWTAGSTGRVVPVRRLWLAAAIVVLNLADVVLTRAVLANGGVEANPLMQGLMSGLAAPLGLKAVVAGTAGILLLLCPPQARLGERAVAAVVALYGVVVVWNGVVLTLLLTS